MLQKNKSVIVLAITAAVIANLCIIAPFSRKLSGQKAQIDMMKSLADEKQDAVEQLKNTNDIYASLNKELPTILPSIHTTDIFIDHLKTTAADKEVKIQSIADYKVADLGSFKELSLAISLESNLENIVSFIYTLRKESVILVQSLKLYPINQGSELLKADLILSTVFVKES